MRKLLLMLCTLLTTFTIPSLTQAAEQQKSFANYDVHYSVFNSTFISPKVAAAYGIVRGKNRGLVNISIREQLKSGEDVAKRAIVTGSSSDLIHRIELNFTEIIEKGAIYYIAEFTFDDKDLRHFDIKVQPNPNISPYQLKFSKALYKDE